MVAGLGLALLSVAASAHAELLQSSPPPGAVLESVPHDVTLVFSEPVTPAGAGIKVFSPSGQQVAGPAVSQGPSLAGRLTSGETGTYVVSWQVYAADTHPSRGVFAFVVGRPSDNPYASLLNARTAGTATPLGLALQAVARWVHFIGFALVFGVVAYAFVVRGATVPGRLATAGVILLVAAEPLSLIAQLASLSFDGDTALAVLGSSFGRLLGLRLGAALLTWALLATGRAWPVLAVGGAIALLDGAGAHSIPGLPGAGQLLVAVHAAAIGLWTGGIVAFIARPDRRFARFALWTLGAAVSTGLVLALGHTRFGVGLFTSDYGRVLLVKASIVVAAVVAAAVRRHRPELGLAFLAIGAAALVAALPPPF